MATATTLCLLPVGNSMMRKIAQRDILLLPDLPNDPRQAGQTRN